MRNITIINQSTLVKDSDLQTAVAALQIQVRQHFAPVWDLDAHLTPVTVSPTHVINPNVEHIVLLDNSDQAGALGYHLLTDNDVPQGFAFVKDAESDGEDWSSVVSHELLEQLLDPLANTTVVVKLSKTFGADAGKMAAVNYEVADPVEGDNYKINGVTVSNFVLPSWFVDVYSAAKVAKFDFMGKLKESLAMTAGGYVAYSTDLSNWSQVTARKDFYKHYLSRFWRRHLRTGSFNTRFGKYDAQEIRKEGQRLAKQMVEGKPCSAPSKSRT